MKVALIFCLGLVAALASPAKKLPQQRRYDPSEEDMYRTKYLLVEDGDGKFRVEDLTIPADPNARASAEDVTFFLYTQSNPEEPVAIRGNDFSAISNSNFNPSKKSVFTVHGWNNNYLSPINTNIRSAIIASRDVNMFVVDWSGPANEFYTTAKDAVPDVGKVIGDFINYVTSTYGVSMSNFLLVGHSLGAHVVGCAGAALNGQLPVIVGLDPAGPLYTVGNIDNRIDESDAQFVHIIHTNGILLGFNTASGTADYYPNGGKTQPGCGFDIAGTCAHGRAYYYFSESILEGTFRAFLCDSQDNYEDGKCADQDESLMGEFDVDTEAYGDYYLITNEEEPYALG